MFLSHTSELRDYPKGTSYVAAEGAVNVVVWALVSGTGGHLAYPWPVWVAGPYGAVLFAVSAGVMLFRRSLPPATRRQPTNG